MAFGSIQHKMKLGLRSGGLRCSTTKKVEQIVNLPCQIYTRNMSIPGSRLNRNPETRTKPTQIGFGLPSQPHAADLDKIDIFRTTTEIGSNAIHSSGRRDAGLRPADGGRRG